jgi:Sulfotransferase family
MLQSCVEGFLREVRVLMSLWTDFQADIDGLHPHLPVSAVVYGTNISLRYNYIFVETPKCACTPIKMALQRLELRNPAFERENFEDIHNRENSPLLNPKQVGSFRHLVSSPRMFKFCFVRHPFTRLLSCYLDKIQGNRPQKAAILRQLGLSETRLSTPVTFEQFVRAVVEQPVSVMDPHWRIQYFQTMQAGIKYDFIGRCERFSDGVRVLEERIAPEFGACLPLEIRNATSAKTEVANYLTSELKDAVYRKFELDFEHFGYSASG